MKRDTSSQYQKTTLLAPPLATTHYMHCAKLWMDVVEWWVYGVAFVKVAILQVSPLILNCANFKGSENAIYGSELYLWSICE